MKLPGTRDGAWIAIAIVSVGLLLTDGVLADGFRNPPDGAAALGRGAARRTWGQDPSVVTHNPANMRAIEKSVIMPSATIGYTQIEYTAPVGISEKTESPWRVLPSVYGVWPGDRCTFGVGVNVPYGQSTEWKRDGIFGRQGLPYFAEMFTLNTTPAVAFDLSEALSFGTGLNVMYSELEFKQNLGPSLAKACGDGWGFGANAGLTWRLDERQVVALTYQSPVSIDYDGDFKVNNPPFPIPAGTSDFGSEIDLPASYGVAYGLKASDKLRLECYVEYVEHSRNERIALDLGVNNPVVDLSDPTGRVLPQDWDDTWSFGIGGDWQATEGCVLRAGWSWLPTPVPERTLMTTLPENDIHFAAVGAGLDLAGGTLDLAYTYSIADDVTVSGNVEEAVNGNYAFNSQLMVLSYSYGF